MDENIARQEIQRTFQLIEELKLLANNVNHEFDMDNHNLREAVRHLNAFYFEMAEVYRKSQESKLEDGY